LVGFGVFHLVSVVGYELNQHHNRLWCKQNSRIIFGTKKPSIARGLKPLPQ
jgi:hypothetical protein